MQSFSQQSCGHVRYVSPLSHAPLGHVAGVTQTPLWQTCPPLQAWPQLPQLLLLELIFTSHPLAGFKSQFLISPVQATQVPPEQYDVLLQFVPAVAVHVGMQLVHEPFEHEILQEEFAGYVYCIFPLQ